MNAVLLHHDPDYAVNDPVNAELLPGAILKLPVEANIPTYRYTVRPGDSLWTIAKRYNTSLRACFAFINTSVQHVTGA